MCFFLEEKEDVYKKLVNNEFRYTENPEIKIKACKN